MELEEQIEDLKSYAELCETRIHELSPNHPLPVTMDHLGLTPTPVKLTDQLTFPTPSTSLTH
jgi:chromosome segregation ATPase